MVSVKIRLARPYWNKPFCFACRGQELAIELPQQSVEPDQSEDSETEDSEQSEEEHGCEYEQEEETQLRRNGCD